MQPFDRRLQDLLAVAARVFAEQGFHRTSMRDLSRASKMSLAGMYYYVKSKDDLLFQIQRNSFEQVLAGAEAVVAGAAEPEERLAGFIKHHVTFFTRHMAEMKVLSHEAESLTGGSLDQVRALKRRYVELCVGLLADLDAKTGGAPVDRNVAAYTLFGMMNWIYTWYDPAGPVGVGDLADAICRLFMHGYTTRTPEPSDA
jgi:TetR/AcrR family transcriptional regulator, cholesterol catabolism regulator